MQVDITYKGQLVKSITEVGETLCNTKNKYLTDNLSVNVVSGGGSTEDATATAADILSPKTAYIASGKVTGTMETKSKSDITVSNNTATIPSGYYATSPTIAASELVSGSETKTTNGTYDVTNLAEVVVNVSGGGVDPSDATATASDIAQGKTAYIATGKITGTMPNIIASTEEPTAEQGSNGDIWFLISE